MKKLYTLVIGCFSFFYSSGQASIGVKTGVNVATIQFHMEGQNSSARFGVYAGGFLEAKLNSRLFIRPEVTYSGKGYRFTFLSQEKETAQFNYLTVPLLLGFRATHRLLVMIGPEFGYLLSAKLKDNSTEDFTERFKRFDKGIDLGLAFRFANHLAAELRYNYGLKGIQEGYYTDQNGNRTTFNTASNRVLQIGLSYSFTQ